jgi:uracil-DNA glycosylase
VALPDGATSKALPFVVVEIVEPLEQNSQPLRRNERSPSRPVINPFTRRHHARSSSRPGYPHLGTTAHTVGLGGFSVAPDVGPVPGSPENIFREPHGDPGLPRRSSGDLTPWTRQGGLLLNRALTTAPRKPAAHRGKGWGEVTEQAVRSLPARGKPLVSIPWGPHARNLRPQLGSSSAIESAHASPMPADRGFFGPRPPSRATDLLVRRGPQPVDRRLR